MDSLDFSNTGLENRGPMTNGRRKVADMQRSMTIPSSRNISHPTPIDNLLAAAAASKSPLPNLVPMQPIQPTPIHAQSTIPNTCFVEKHPLYMDAVMRLNHLDYTYRTAEQYYLGQLTACDQTIRSAELLINQLMAENHLWMNMVQMRDKEINDLRMSEGTGVPSSASTSSSASASFNFTGQ